MNRSTLARFVLVIIGLIILGCFPVSTHQGADLSKAEEFHIEKNKTTEKELVDRFGPPCNTVTRGDGTRMLSWTDSRGQGTVNTTKFLRDRGAVYREYGGSKDDAPLADGDRAGRGGRRLHDHRRKQSHGVLARGDRP